MDVRKKLKYLADELLRMKDHEEALRDLGRRNPEQASAIENIFAALENLDKAKEIDKLMSVVSLIKENILKSKGYNNFSEKEYQEDKNKIFNIKSKLVSTNDITVKRGLLGSADVAHSDDDPLLYFFGNE